MTITIQNMFSHIPTQIPEEIVEQLVQHDSVKIERIVSRGHASPEDFWYDQETQEFVLLLSGSAQILYENEENSTTLHPGDWILIPAHVRHRVLSTDKNTDTVWLAIHF